MRARSRPGASRRRAPRPDPKPAVRRSRARVLRRYGLERDPFADHDDCFFSTAACAQRLELLRHFLGGPQAQAVALVEERGAGKRTLARRLVTELGLDWEACRVPPGPGTLASLREHVAARAAGAPEAARDAAPLLVVEEAHALTAQALEHALALGQGRAAPAARLLLVGESGLQARLNEVLEDDWVPMVDLPPWDVEAVGDYVHLRLARAGLVGNSPFTDGMIRSIHHAANGRPGAVNALARQLLLERGRGARGGRRRALAAALGLGALLGAALLWLLWDASAPERALETPRSRTTLPLELPPRGAAPD